MTSFVICAACTLNDHSGHIQRLGGICVGCECDFVPEPVYDLSPIMSDERFSGQKACIFYEWDGWLTNGDVAVKRGEVDPSFNALVPPRPMNVSALLGRRTKLFDATNVLILQHTTNLHLFVAQDGDVRFVDSVYADVFGDVSTLYGDEIESTPLQNAEKPDDVTVVIMPIARVIAETDIATLNYFRKCIRNAQIGIASYLSDIDKRIREVRRVKA